MLPVRHDDDDIYIVFVYNLNSRYFVQTKECAMVTIAAPSSLAIYLEKFENPYD